MCSTKIGGKNFTDRGGTGKDCHRKNPTGKDIISSCSGSDCRCLFINITFFGS